MSNSMNPGHLWIGVTDRAWFDFLKARPGLDEVNFWLPGGKQGFRALAPGEPFLFKLHKSGSIVGGGFFSHFSFLPCSLAWEAFEEKNGVASLAELRQRIGGYRTDSAAHQEDFVIGCVMLRSPFFLPREAWLPVPESWASNLPRGRGYSTSSEEGMRLWARVAKQLPASMLAEARRSEGSSSMYGPPTLIHPRLGQGTFRVMITDTYERRCAMTGEKALPVLEAAHIRPVAEGGEHWIDNGLLLRSDLHRLFDRGYVTVTPDYRAHVSRRLREEYGNGEIYLPLDGKRIWTPSPRGAQPNSLFLEWHSDTVFRP